VVKDSTGFRIGRVIAGAVLLTIGLLRLFHGPRDVIFDVVGSVLLITGIVGMPRIYALFGVSGGNKGPRHH